MNKENKAEQTSSAEEKVQEQAAQAEEQTKEQTKPEAAADECAEAEAWKKKYDEIYDKYLRMLAEYDNYKKRTLKEKDELYSFAVADTLERLLPVLDNLERAADAAEEKSPLADGVKMVLKQFGETLEKLDVTPIEAVGREFDPNIHNAVMHVEDEEAGANIVVEEFQKGYKHKERVIRHSMVKVAN